jgi:hypothetical protein
LQIKTNDTGSLGLKLRSIAGHVVAQTVRLQAMVSPNASDHDVGYTQLCCQKSAAPMCAAVIEAPTGPIQNASLSFGCIQRTPASLMKGEKTS